MPPALSPVLALAAVLLEARFGYPEALYQRIGHPVTWIGRAIDALDGALNRAEDAPLARRRAGLAAIAILAGGAALAGFLVQATLSGFGWFGFAPLALLASAVPAQRSLVSHVEAVAEALETRGPEAGRAALAHIVGRDVAPLDEAGIVRAAIESLAESFCDGVVAPVLWLAGFGLGGGFAYKAINTADSMIGHRDARHGDFGAPAAILDDLVNWPAARLAAGLLVVAARSSPGADSGGARRVLVRDGRRHASPNAGLTEAAMAGALGLALGGPRAYGGETVDAPTLGEGRRDASVADLRRALDLQAHAARIGLAALAVATLAAVVLG